jgi:hypothetical protein
MTVASGGARTLTCGRVRRACSLRWKAVSVMCASHEPAERAAFLVVNGRAVVAFAFEEAT